MVIGSRYPDAGRADRRPRITTDAVRNSLLNGLGHYRRLDELGRVETSTVVAWTPIRRAGGIGGDSRVPEDAVAMTRWNRASFNYSGFRSFRINIPLSSP